MFHERLGLVVLGDPDEAQYSTYAPPVLDRPVAKRKVSLTSRQYPPHSDRPSRNRPCLGLQHMCHLTAAIPVLPDTVLVLCFSCSAETCPTNYTCPVTVSPHSWSSLTMAASQSSAVGTGSISGASKPSPTKGSTWSPPNATNVIAGKVVSWHRSPLAKLSSTSPYFVE